MKKTPYRIVLISLFLIGVITACNMPSTLTDQTATETPTSIAQTTKAATPVPSATITVITATPSPEFAPNCKPGTVSASLPVGCQLPVAEQGSAFCTKKTPYNLILMNEGATHEVWSEHIRCSDAGMKDGRQMLTCTGPLAKSFEVRVCDPGCAVPMVQAEITKCPQDYTYNPFQGCCSQEPLPIDQSCVLLKLKTKSCAIDCGQYAKKSECSNNGYACKWDDTNKVCLLR